ncbi:hypothetical protein GCM10027074_64590 [Streptomyces deserti]
MAATPPDWGVQYTLCLPGEDTARAAAAEPADSGHRLTAVRVHDHFRFAPSGFRYGEPSTDPELEGWWQDRPRTERCTYRLPGRERCTAACTGGGVPRCAGRPSPPRWRERPWWPPGAG